MKKIGIIGGAGPLASALFYESLVQESYKHGRFLPEIFLLNYPFSRGLTPQESKENESVLLKQISYCIDILVEHGCEASVLVCNTMHHFLKQLQSELRFHFLPELVLQEAKKHVARRLLLLATQNTARFGLYHDPECEIIVAAKDEQQVVDRVIDNVLQGRVTQEDSHLISDLLCKITQEYDGVVLGCTDLPVLHHHYPIQSKKPIYDSIKIPAKTLAGIL